MSAIPADQLVCNACQCPIKSEQDRVTHYKSEWHRYNVKRRCAGLQSIPQALFESQLAALQAKKAADASEKNTQKCKVCNKTFASTSSYTAHLQSKKHIKRVQNKGDIEDSEIQADDDEEETTNATVAATPSGNVEIKDGMVEDDEEGEDDEDEEDGEPIPLKHCLFCKLNFETLELSLDHMLKQHGFFIPFVENLIDLEGMMEYLGEKVGIGRVCLYCAPGATGGKGKIRWPTVQAVQQHMNAKSHCKLRLDTEEAEEELESFYDFDKDNDAEMEDGESEQKLVSVDQSKPKRQMAHMNELGEIVLNDGSIVGHRSLNRVYRQNVRPSNDDRLVVVNNLSKSYLATVPNYKNDKIASKFRGQAKWLRHQKRALHGANKADNIQHHFRAQVNF